MEAENHNYIGSTDEGDVPTTTLNEVKDVIEQLKNDKAAIKGRFVCYLSVLIDSQDLGY